MQAGVSSTSTWMQALRAASLLAGAKVEELDGAVCVGRNDVRAYLMAEPLSATAACWR